MTSDCFPLNDPEKIQKLATIYWDTIGKRDKEQERMFPKEIREARRNGYLSKDLFVRIARWKSVRNTRNYNLNSEAEIRAATACAFQASDDKTSIEALMNLHGVALRTATAILHWMHPDRFPVLDFRVIAALGEPEPKSYNYYTFHRVSDLVRKIACEHSLDLRTIDRALWTWDKLQSKSMRSRCRDASYR